MSLMRVRWPPFLVLAVVLALCRVAGAQSSQPTTLQGYVTRVVDGDTIYVMIGSKIEKVRYIGINTPEIHHPTKGHEPYGEDARQANVRLVDGRWNNLVRVVLS